MADDWRIVPLESCMAAIIDYRGKTPKKTSAGIPLITAKVVKAGRIEPPEEFISAEDYEPWMRRGIPEAGDVVITTEAPLGEVAQLGSERVALAQRLIALRGEPTMLDNTFLKFLMQSHDIQQQLQSRASGTTVFGIKQSELRRVLLRLPPVGEQRAIGHVLGTLDAKIDINRRMNETLEAITKALFKSWFIDFDPVRAKMEARDDGLPKHVSDFFPDSFEDAEFGEIPKGWTSGKIGDVAENPRRGIQPDHIHPERAYIALEHMPRRSICLSDWEFGKRLESTKYEFKRGEILFGKLRPYFHKVGVAPIDGVCSTDILVVKPKSRSWFGFLLAHLSSFEFIEYTNASSTGTKMPRTSWSEMSRYPVAFPPQPLVKKFSSFLVPLVNRMIISIHESRTLAALRDTLLPRLISGELRINDPERFMIAR